MSIITKTLASLCLFILVSSIPLTPSTLTAQGQLMSSYAPTQDGKEFKCGPSEECSHYSWQQQTLCGCSSSKSPYTTVSYIEKSAH